VPTRIQNSVGRQNLVCPPYPAAARGGKHAHKLQAPEYHGQARSLLLQCFDPRGLQATFLFQLCYALLIPRINTKMVPSALLNAQGGQRPPSR